MKLMHSTTTTLNTKQFNKLSDRIIEALFELNPDAKELYDIHVNYISDNWKIDFLPIVDDIPVINVDTFTDQRDDGSETLKLVPTLISELPGRIRLEDENGSYDLCMNYVTAFEFILALYDFSYELS